MARLGSGRSSRVGPKKSEEVTTGPNKKCLRVRTRSRWPNLKYGTTPEMARLTLQKVLLLDYLEVERTWHWCIAPPLEPLWKLRGIWAMVVDWKCGRHESELSSRYESLLVVM